MANTRQQKHANRRKPEGKQAGDSHTQEGLLHVYSPERTEGLLEEQKGFSLDG